MDKSLFSLTAHRDHIFWNPVSPLKFDRLISLLKLDNKSKVIDFGAGNCELLIRLIENFNLEATAVDILDTSEYVNKRSENRINQSRLNLVVSCAEDYLKNMGEQRFDMLIAIGASHAFGTYENLLESLKSFSKKGSYILTGETYWKKKPAPEYLEALGEAEESSMRKHEENIFLAEEKGLIPLWSCTASEEDWDNYEWLYSMSVENFVEENPAHPDAEEMRARIRSWRTTYLKWGRDTLGFGLYLFRC